MYSAELANRPIPRELDGGGAGALIAEKVTLICLLLIRQFD
jgi:hypothetical protein